jgi:hypothetical protein
MKELNSQATSIEKMIPENDFPKRERARKSEKEREEQEHILPSDPLPLELHNASPPEH